MLIEPGSGFSLRIRNFPNFKSSVVKYKNQIFIPQSYGSGNFVMIGLKDGKPHFYKFPPAAIEELAPVGDLNDYMIIGIKEGKLQILPWKYDIYWTSEDLPLKCIADVLKDAQLTGHTPPKKQFEYFHSTNKWLMFYGWRNLHCWLPGTNYLCRRIHIFYRAIREETPAARTKDGCSLNYTWFE
jgi:hypothetical protein